MCGKSKKAVAGKCCHFPATAFDPLLALLDRVTGSIDKLAVSFGLGCAPDNAAYPKTSTSGWPVLRGREIPSLLRRDSNGTPSAW